MNTALRVVRPRTPIDVSDKAGGGLDHALNAGVERTKFQNRRFGEQFSSAYLALGKIVPKRQ
jgi:hypothetical protein